MREDEIRHGTAAETQGASALPAPVKSVMRGISRIMTTLSYRI
jgi:ubiquinone biosynthesis monooxygenase Coq7